MSPEKLQSIIKSKNENLEYEAVRRVTAIIDEIASNQQEIVAHQEQIEALRKELKTYEIPQLDATKILG
jgi:polyhydroxyalkanoate synthesis regulator phasin